MVPVFGRRGGEVVAALPSRTNVIAVLILIAFVAVGALATAMTNNPAPLIALSLLGVLLMQSPKVAQQWERAIVLRLRRCLRSAGPRRSWNIPVTGAGTC